MKESDSLTTFWNTFPQDLCKNPFEETLLRKNPINCKFEVGSLLLKLCNRSGTATKECAACGVW
jgi:hypothetical protein